MPVSMWPPAELRVQRRPLRWLPAWNESTCTAHAGTSVLRSLGKTPRRHCGPPVDQSPGQTVQAPTTKEDLAGCAAEFQLCSGPGCSSHTGALKWVQGVTSALGRDTDVLAMVGASKDGTLSPNGRQTGTSARLSWQQKCACPWAGMKGCLNRGVLAVLPSKLPQWRARSAGVSDAVEQGQHTTAPRLMPCAAQLKVDL